MFYVANLVSCLPDDSFENVEGPVSERKAPAGLVRLTRE